MEETIGILANLAKAITGPLFIFVLFIIIEAITHFDTTDEDK